MSLVSGVTVIVRCSESDSPDADPGGDIRDRLNAWLEERGYPKSFAVVDEHYGGSKHPQQVVLGAGLNHFSEQHEAFASFVVGMPWESPGNVVIIIQPEDGETIVRRPLELGETNAS